jgi:hypothetical protein
MDRSKWKNYLREHFTWTAQIEAGTKYSPNVKTSRKECEDESQGMWKTSRKECGRRLLKQ